MEPLDSQGRGPRRNMYLQGSFLSISVGASAACPPCLRLTAPWSTRQKTFWRILCYCSATQSTASPIICQPQLKILGKRPIGLAWVRMSPLDELNLVRGQCQNKMAAATEAIYSFNKYLEHLLCTKAVC